MDRRAAKKLLEKYRKGACTPEEKRLLDAAFNRIPRLNTRKYTEEEYSGWLAKMWQRLEQETFSEKRSERTRVKTLIRYAAAATVLIAVAMGAYFYAFQPAGKEPVADVSEIVPGGNKATITLPGGRKVDLSSKKEGVITGPEGLVYNDGSKVKGTDADGLSEEQTSKYLVVATPTGGQYQVRLPDGTKVWLNSASSLRYPASFASGDERRVALSGEGYFEVTRDPSRPFRVVTAKQEIEVLGTHFNINAYLDEPVEKTTLLEGSVRVKRIGGETAHVLVPGQQAVPQGVGFVLREVPVNEVVAWKHGDIVFDGANLEAIMRQISRWYDVEVEYRGRVPQVGFSGSVSRERPIAEVLKALEASQSVHFKMKGRRIVVMP